jgi:uncharacterized repeat protein (TIGR03803 family)
VLASTRAICVYETLLLGLYGHGSELEKIARRWRKAMLPTKSCAGHAGQTGAEAVVYSFQDNGTDGVWPYADLIAVKGALYGTTFEGGVNNGGAVFKITQP